MNPHRVALYARVSSAQQADAGTIVSQLSALRARIAADGLTLSPELEFIDDGYSGSSFLRPGLERLRDVLPTGGIDRLYVLAPDRLARKYAYQVVLLEEFQAGGVEVVFLNRSSGQSAEDELLVQVQGMLAEYERAKILERTRRGKRYAASERSVFSRVRLTAIVMSLSKRVLAKRAMRSWPRKRKWYDRSSSGSARSGLPSKRYAAVWNTPVRGRARARPCGIDLRWGRC
jgi:DNA invertase Pin-like site-specific DNA recombinase